MDKQELEARHRKATLALQELQDKRHKDRRARIEVVNRLMRETYGLKEEELKRACHETKQALDKAEDEARMRDTLREMPSTRQGTKLVVGMKMIKAGWRHRQKAHGVIQVFKDGDDCHQKTAWSKPKHGQVVVRQLKKDGSPSKMAFVWQDYCGWVPEIEVKR